MRSDLQLAELLRYACMHRQTARRVNSRPRSCPFVQQYKLFARKRRRSTPALVGRFFVYSGASLLTPAMRQGSYTTRYTR